MHYKVFISHSSVDTWVVAQIKANIEKSGAECFLDEGCIDIGDDFENVILQELRGAQEILVLLTPWALQRHYVWMEIGAAWGLGLKTIFVLHGLAFETLQSNKDLPVLVKKNNCTELNEIQEYFAQLKKRITRNE